MLKAQQSGETITMQSQVSKGPVASVASRKLGRSRTGKEKSEHSPVLSSNKSVSPSSDFSKTTRKSQKLMPKFILKDAIESERKQAWF